MGHLLLAEVVKDFRVVADELGVRLECRDLRGVSMAGGEGERGTRTVGISSNTSPGPIVPSPMAIEERFTGGLEAPKMALVM